MTTLVFQALKGYATAKYTCLGCGKKREKRFTEECTVNPFNTNDDGTIKSARQVQQQASARAVAAKEKFLRHPLCSKCEPTFFSPEGKIVRDTRAALNASQGGGK
jgi:hypothetical protein